jgi:hypothetical protein
LVKNICAPGGQYKPTWQLGDRRSHNRIVLSKDPDKNESSTGDIHNETTLKKVSSKQG